MQSLRPTLATLILLISFTIASATPVVIIDATPTGATQDGVINAGEYAGSSAGINDGFGGQLAGGALHVDSNSTGDLMFGLETTGVTDYVVIYFDRVPNGLLSTSALLDVDDPHRASVSGRGLAGPGSSTLTFAPGFEADLALVFNGSSAQFYATTPMILTHLGSPTIVYGAGAVEIGIPAAMTGIAPGEIIRYVATIGNPFDASGFYRADEFHGVDPTTVAAGNPGAASVTLAAGDFNSFTVYREEVATATTSMSQIKALY